MNVKDIAALAEIVRKNELTKLEINGEHIVIEREPAIVQTVSAPAAVQTVAEQMHTAEPIAEVQEKEGTYVRSPAVGVFYAAPSRTASRSSPSATRCSAATRSASLRR